MSGHSKWSTIKRKKGAEDAKRGKIFTRLTREIVMSAREGGGDPESNFRLRLAVDRARAQNMPKDNIERAIKRGTGDSKEGESFEEVTYEGYGPSGVALIIECVTENRNRTVADIRHVLTKAGGSMGEGGSVTWQFTRNAYFEIDENQADYDTVFELAVEAGANDIDQEDGYYEIYAPVENYKEISDAFHKAKIELEEAGLRMIPNQELELNKDSTMKVMRTIEDLEDLDDVQNVYSNVRISEEAMAELES